MKLDTSILSVIDTIKAVILGEINYLIYSNQDVINLKKKQPAPFIKFQLIATSIEFLGACYDELPFDYTKRDKSNISEKRFNTALIKLFDKKYDKYAKAGSKHYLYKSFRCAMIHQLRPGKGVSLTTRLEAKEDGNSHLIGGSNESIILILEDLYDDLKKAAEKLIREFESGKVTNKKGEQGYLQITDYQ